MNVSPIFIARTKYIDFEKPVFCAPSDVNQDLLNRLHGLVDAYNLKMAPSGIPYSTIIINDNSHIIIGRLMCVESMEGSSLDYSLDEEKDGRKAWAFIGGVLLRAQYSSESKIQTLPDEYYLRSYVKYLYEPHWLDEGEFKGPYKYPYENISMSELRDAQQDYSCGNIYEDSLNSDLISYVLGQILLGEIISCSTNAEFTASDDIMKKQLSFATVSSSNIIRQKRFLEEKKVQNHNVKTKEDDFYEQLKHDYEQGNLEIKALLAKIASICGYSLVKIKDSSLDDTIGFGVIKQVEHKSRIPYKRKKITVEIEDNESF